MDMRELHRRAVQETGSVLAEITDADWDRPTPCTEWTVRDIVAHMVDNGAQLAAVLDGKDAPEPLRPPDDALVGAYADSGDLIAAAATDEALERSYPLGSFGEFAGRIHLGIRFVDVLVHGWDLAAALERDHEIAPDLAEPALRIAESLPDTPAVRGPGGPFAPARPAPQDATPGERLVAVLGRTPR